MYIAPEGTPSVVEEDLDTAGATRSVVSTATGFLTVPFMLAGTELVGVVPERLARRVALAADIRVLEPDMALRPLRQSAFWHSRRDHDPGHVWLRRQIADTAASEDSLTPMDLRH